MRSDERGFTLLEVLIAFAITAIALTVLYHGGLESLLNTKQAARMNEAVSRARSRLAVACHGQPLMPGVQSGDDGGGFTWRTETIRDETKLIRPSDDALGEPVLGMPVLGAPVWRADLLTVRVTIGWPGGTRQRDVTLVTQCLTSGPPGRP